VIIQDDDFTELAFSFCLNELNYLIMSIQVMIGDTTGIFLEVEGECSDNTGNDIMTKRVAYLGPPGTFSQEALLLYERTAIPVPFPSIPAIALAVSSGMAEEGIVPIENSLEGSVTYTLDLLIQESQLKIRYEVELSIEHYLVAMDGTDTTQVKAIYSHPQALAQCRRFIERCFPKAQHVASLSTAAAVEDMKNSSVPAVAIAPRVAAELYDVSIIAKNIQDNAHNITRFVILSQKDHPPTGNDRTSLCFSFAQDKPGLLHKALGEFAQRGINLAKIESRPVKGELGQYIFLIDCDGHRKDPQVGEALTNLGKMSSLFRIFGSYPRWKGKAE
jgi:prephenate dehydratase